VGGTFNVADTGTLPPRPQGAWNATWTDRLKRDLLLNYDKFARPAQHTNTTVVNLDVTFRHIDLVGLLTSLLPYKNIQGWFPKIVFTRV
jgi:hypothetical protein